ncbi:Hypothetical protein A7982_05060 [Minicystis rosea]|nr:Hypothetical protein A7982_05060 [Minicystis rosea]
MSSNDLSWILMSPAASKDASPSVRDHGERPPVIACGPV